MEDHMDVDPPLDGDDPIVWDPGTKEAPVSPAANFEGVMDEILLHMSRLNVAARTKLKISAITAEKSHPVLQTTDYRRLPRNESQFTCSCEIKGEAGGKYLSARSILDCGATGEAFVNKKYAQLHKLPLWPLPRPCRLEFANGGEGEPVRFMTLLHVKQKNHYSQVAAYVTDLGGSTDFILGMPWLREHNPDIDWTENTLTFPHTCQDTCMWEPPQNSSDPAIKEKYANIETVSLPTYLKLIRRKNNRAFSLLAEDFDQLDKPPDSDAEWVIKRMVDSPELKLSAITSDDYAKFFKKLRDPGLTMEQIKAMLPTQYKKYAKAFDPKLPMTSVPASRGQLDHRLDLIPGKEAPACKPRGTSRETAGVIKAYIDDMLGKGHIRPSTSPFAAPILVCAKPGGGLRVCVDYRNLNEITIRNRNVPPIISETLNRLSKARIFSKFDVILAFNEIRIREGDEYKTAFITRWGLFEYLVMPFGLTNAPATWQRFINEILRPFLDVFVTAYLDDILVYSSSEAEHTAHVSQVLEKLIENHVFLDIHKSEFHTKRVRYLGIIVSVYGIEMDPRKTEAVKNWPTPSTLKDVQAFLGFANFYRRFIAGFSGIVAPLTNLTKGRSGNPKIHPLWGKSEEEAFQKLKLAFTSAPILKHFDPDKVTYLETDSSDYVLAAVLSQIDEKDNLLHPVAFLSKKMTPAECNYDIYDKELLAIIRAFEEWEPELAGTKDPIEVITDHNNLRGFMAHKLLNRRQARWAEFLSEFNFRITHRAGKLNTKADSMTRLSADLPAGVEDPREQHRFQQLIKEKHLVPRGPGKDESSHQAIHIAKILTNDFTVSVQEATTLLFSIVEAEAPGVPLGSPESRIPNLLQHVQECYGSDEILQRIIAAKKSNERRIPMDLFRKGVILEMGMCEIGSEGQDKDLLLVNGRVYVPASARPEVMKQHHDSLVGGHAGREETYAKIARHYYWPGMTTAIREWVAGCEQCRKTKPYTAGKQGLLRPLTAPSEFWSDVSMDFITPLPTCTYDGRHYRHILVVVDRLSKMKRFIALESLEVDHVVTRYIEWLWRTDGYPKSILSDRGSQFTSRFWKRLCERIGTTPKLSSAYHPETDGQTERTNAVLKNYLRAYVNFHQDDWAQYLAVAEFVANSTKSTTTNMIPFEAVLGRVPRMGTEPAVENQDRTSAQRTQREGQQAVDMIARRNAAEDVCRQQMQWAQAIQKEYADRHRIPAPEFKVGDMVMLDTRNLKTNRPSMKLDFKNLGRFKVIEVGKWGSAIKLELPQSYKIYPWFHPSLVHLAGNPMESQKAPPSPEPLEVREGQETYEVEDILDSKWYYNRKCPVLGIKKYLRYLVKWTGYQKPDWEWWDNVTGCPALIAKFHEKFPEKDGPHPSFLEYDSTNWDKWEADIDKLFESEE